MIKREQVRPLTIWKNGICVCVLYYLEQIGLLVTPHRSDVSAADILYLFTAAEASVEV